jgi:hypothetical protein
MLSVCQQSADRNAKGVVLGIVLRVTFLPAPVQVVVFTANSNSDASDIREGTLCALWRERLSAYTRCEPPGRRDHFAAKDLYPDNCRQLTISDNLKRSVGYYLWSHVGHLLSHH